MARFTIRASSFSFLLRRHLSSSPFSQKFSLVKLQRDQVSSQDVACPYNRVPETVRDSFDFQPSAKMELAPELRECLSASASASAPTEEKRSGSVWWGPDAATGTWTPCTAATGTWTPSTSAEKTANAISSPTSALNANLHKAGHAFWYREDVHL
ncbi:hypothetical protein KP509_10G014500 [Ceratopteris richardii]|uniref:Uncharacterized protein n=1 Tax=Ceratopteris richardii TaxID=49495 RepID=A0A8T2TZC3_CERRI|nr:hypothetical protein KP509_10G014500 [Ceratopteris richardii]